MSAEILVATITAAVGIGSALLAWSSSRKAVAAEERAIATTRLDDVEERLERSDRTNHLLWLWNRSLVDHVYRELPPPPPSPPEGLFQ